MRVLLLESDRGLAADLVHRLAADGYAVDWIRGVTGMERFLDTPSYDLLLLEAAPPDGSALDFLRNARPGIPTILSTAGSCPRLRTQALDAGADDCLARPFDLDELCARARAVLRRQHQHDGATLEHGDIRLDPASHRVTRNGEPVGLSKRQFALLRILMHNRGRTLPRSALEQKLYSWDDDVDSNTVQVHIHGLRQVLGKDFIRTVRGVGYVIDAE